MLHDTSNGTDLNCAFFFLTFFIIIESMWFAKVTNVEFLHFDGRSKSQIFQMFKKYFRAYNDFLIDQFQKSIH